jgi:nitroreductase
MVIVTRKDLLEELSRVCMDSWGLMTRFINIPVINLLFVKMLGKLTYPLFSELARYYKEERAYYEAGEDPILFHGNVILITAPAGEKMGYFEAGLATMSLMLCAETLGLGTCLSGILMAMQGKVKKVLGIPDDVDICGAVIIGHPDIKRYGAPHRKERPVLHM